MQCGANDTAGFDHFSRKDSRVLVLFHGVRGARECSVYLTGFPAEPDGVIWLFGGGGFQTVKEGEKRVREVDGRGKGGDESLIGVCECECECECRRQKGVFRSTVFFVGEERVRKGERVRERMVRGLLLCPRSFTRSYGTVSVPFHGFSWRNCYQNCKSCFRG